MPATPAPASTPTALIYFGKPAVRFRLDARALGFDADGNARWLVLTKFFDAQGNATRIMANSDIDWRSRDGYVQWQTRLRYGQPAAILKTQRNGPLTMNVRANVPRLGTVTVHTDTRTWHGPRIVAQVLGPHAVAIGWFPRESTMARIVRIDGRGRRRTLVVIAGPSSSYRDETVLPGQHYRYVLDRADHRPVALSPVTTFPPPPATRVANAGGKAMWLFFTTNPIDTIYYNNLDPQAIVAQAVRAGLHYVELRTAYGAYWEVTPEAKPTIDAIIDGLAAHGIGTIGWTVPRDTTVEDLRQSLRTAYYRTAKGTPLTGLAIDVERGDEFMGGAPQGPSALWQYVRDLRAALGPRYLLVATVEDAYLEHLTQRQYPYEQIARYSDVLQPMAYWRMMRRKPTTPVQVDVLLRASYAKLVREARRSMPISIGGQTDNEGRNGYPPASEITASLATSKAVGAIGECFFDWDATQPAQWDALAGYRW
ncbi:MAG: hypothetical protein M3R44_07540 [Candidatus Eremiobacteraeota bacterium]|nr:hypothetical protein [Candidatus Eremiobacteraeota bacterium]